LEDGSKEGWNDCVMLGIKVVDIKNGLSVGGSVETEEGDKLGPTVVEKLGLKKGLFVGI
jgi:hypothetical protein